MRYSEPLSGQIWTFLAFSGVGFLLGGVYAAFSFLRALFKNGRRATAVCDLLFCACAFGVLFAAFLGYTDGVWRLPELLAAAGGFLAFSRTVGKLLRGPLFRLAAVLRQIADAVPRPVRALADRLQTTLAGWRARLLQSVAAERERRKRRRADSARRAEKKSPKKTKKRKKTLAKPIVIQYNDS